MPNKATSRCAAMVAAAAAMRSPAARIAASGRARGSLPAQLATYGHEHAEGVGVNCFDGARRYRPDAVRRALDLDPSVPVVLCDARQRASCRDALIALVEHALQVLRDRSEHLEGVLDQGDQGI